MMGASHHRALVEMMWEKEQDLQSLFRPDASLIVPGEGWWRAACANYGRKCTLPQTQRVPNDIKLSLYMHLLHDRQRRVDMKEMFEVVYTATVHNKMVAAMASKGEHGSMDGKALETVFAFLHNVQKITNPAAIAPQSETADQLEQDMDALKDYFTTGPVLKITPLG